MGQGLGQTVPGRPAFTLCRLPSGETEPFRGLAQSPGGFIAHRPFRAPLQGPDLGGHSLRAANQAQGHGGEFAHLRVWGFHQKSNDLAQFWTVSQRDYTARQTTSILLRKRGIDGGRSSARQRTITTTYGGGQGAKVSLASSIDGHSL